jgi:hypothetical protein
MRSFLLAAVAAVGGVCAAGAQGAVLYSTAGSVYSQNFDTLPNSPENASLGDSPAGWIDDTTTPGTNQFSIPGWYLFHPTSVTEGGANGRQRMRVGAGTTNTGAFWSFGAATSTERALGNVGSNTTINSGGAAVYGARFTNNTGVTLNEFTLDFIAEQWRDGGTTTTGSVAQSVTFGWKVAAANIQDTGFTSAPLGFTSPTFGATAGTGLDGNAAANRVAVGPTSVTGINWAHGTDLWIRWSDVDHGGNDHGLAIDDLHFSASEVPEPAGLAVLALGAVGLVTRRRRLA